MTPWALTRESQRPRSLVERYSEPAFHPIEGVAGLVPCRHHQDEYTPHISPSPVRASPEPPARARKRHRSFIVFGRIVRSLGAESGTARRRYVRPQPAARLGSDRELERDAVVPALRGRDARLVQQLGLGGTVGRGDGCVV